jgi:hypothetical protein
VADLPKGLTPEMQVWSPEQLGSFLQHVRWVTRSMRPGCCSPRPACDVARSPASAGQTSTWRSAASPAPASGGRQL